MLNELSQRAEVGLGSDIARIAARLFAGSRHDLPNVLADAQGGRNVIAAGLSDDIAFAARLNAIDVAGVVKDEPLCVGRG